MHLPAEIFLAFRYLKPKRSFVSVITLLTLLGPMLGVSVLIIVRSVMAGFDHDIRTGIMNMQAHITVYEEQIFGYFSPQRAELIINALENGPHGIKATPVIEANALIQQRNSVYPKIIRGIDPARESNVTKIQENFSTQGLQLHDKQAVIGKRLASMTGLKQGDDLLIHSPARLTSGVRWNSDGSINMHEPDEIYFPEQATIIGYYEMGVADFDDNIIIIHQDQAADLMGIPWGSASSIQCSVPDPMNMTAIMNDLRKNFPNLSFISWQEKNAILFNTLKMEQNLMTFLLAFIILVAAFSIASTLITVVVQKTKEIGIMKSIGMSNATVARLFLLQGGIIGIIGTCAGAILGLLVLKHRNSIAMILGKIMGHDIFPAELYHLTSIPALTSTGDLIAIIVGAILTCILASLFPAIYASSFSPAISLKTDN